MKRLKEGDVFSIPLDESSVGFGQIFKIFDIGYHYLILVYGVSASKVEIVPLEKITNGEIVFMGITLDAKWYHNDWKVIGNASVTKKITLPFFKIGLEPEAYITDYAGNNIRIATELEFKILDYKTISAPVIFEDAIKAFFGKKDWSEDYEKLKYIHVVEKFHRLGDDIKKYKSE